MRTMFAQVARDDHRIDRGLASLLGRAYKFKEFADYAVGSQGVVTGAQAQGVIDIAQRFVATITSLLPPDTPDPAEVPDQTSGGHARTRLGRLPLVIRCVQKLLETFKLLILNLSSVSCETSVTWRANQHKDPTCRVADNLPIPSLAAYSS